MTSPTTEDAAAIRLLRADDAEGIVALYASSMAAEPDIGPITAEGWTRTIALPQFGGGRDFLVALDGSTIVGIAESSLRDQGHRRIRNVKLVVSPAARRRGLGTALLRAVLAQGPCDEPLMLQANLSVTWTAGLGFLSRFGFVQIEAEIYMRCPVLLPVRIGPDGVTVRRVVEVGSVAARLAEIHNAAYRDDVGFSRVDADGMRSSFADAILWVAERDGAIVGHAKIESDDDVSWLESLAVDPAHQGCGIGGLLASRAFLGDRVGESRPAGLSVSSANPRALRLYERLGFERRGEKCKYAASRDDLLGRLGGRRRDGLSAVAVADVPHLAPWHADGLQRCETAPGEIAPGDVVPHGVDRSVDFSREAAGLVDPGPNRPGIADDGCDPVQQGDDVLRRNIPHDRWVGVAEEGLALCRQPFQHDDVAGAQVGGSSGHAVPHPQHVVQFVDGDRSDVDPRRHP